MKRNFDRMNKDNYSEDYYSQAKKIESSMKMFIRIGCLISFRESNIRFFELL